MTQLLRLLFVLGLCTVGASEPALAQAISLTSVDSHLSTDPHPHDSAVQSLAAGGQILDLYVSGFFSSSAQRFYGPLSDTPGAAHPAPGQTKAFYATNISRRPWGLAFGPSGNLYLATPQGGSGAVVRVYGPFSNTPGAPDPAPGQTGDIFVPNGFPSSLSFGPDGNLYVGGNGHVQRYDAVEGIYLGEFTSGYAPAQVNGLAFGPDGNLYVSSFNSCVSTPVGCGGRLGEILRYDGSTGTFLGTFISFGTGGLDLPEGIAFGPDGNLYVANNHSFSNQSGSVLRYYGPLSDTPGSPDPSSNQVGAGFASHSGLNPLLLTFGPDGNLYASSSDSSATGGEVDRYNATTGEFIGTFALVDGSPRGLTFYPSESTGPSMCAANITSQIRIVRGGFRYNYTSGQFVQTVTLTNISANVLPGPLSLVLDNLRSNATLFNRSGETTCTAVTGSPYVNIDLGGDIALNPGQTVRVVLQFGDPSKTGISYNTRVLGVGNR